MKRRKNCYCCNIKLKKTQISGDLDKNVVVCVKCHPKVEFLNYNEIEPYKIQCLII